MRLLTSFVFFFICLQLSSCTTILFQPVKEHTPLPDEVLENVNDFYFESFDKAKLHGWHLSSRIKPDEPEQTVLFLHGNAMNISNHLGGVYWLPDFGIEAYIFDYRGYGKSEGVPFLQGILLDIDYAISTVISRLDTNQKIWIIGHSVGASMGIYAISQSRFKNRIKGYIAVSAFSDYHEVTRNFLSRHWSTWLFQWPLSYTVNNEYTPLAYIQDVSPVPVYFIHGEKDAIIKHDHSRVLYEHALEPKNLAVFKANHNDIFFHNDVKNYILELIVKSN